MPKVRRRTFRCLPGLESSSAECSRYVGFCSTVVQFHTNKLKKIFLWNFEINRRVSQRR